MSTVLRAFAALAAVVLLALPATAQSCAGDCNRDGSVTIDETVFGIGIALGSRPADLCRQLDRDRDGRASVDELLAAVAQGLYGCPDTRLRLNQIQVLGSHNSYHVRAGDELFALLAAFDAALAASLDYTHPPLDVQFDEQGIRQIELDVFADPDGGLYASPAGLRLVSGNPEARLPDMDAPGFKVLHVQDIDYETRCATFVGCLEEVKAWSDAHPGHVPILVLVEAKDDRIPDPLNLGFVIPLPIDKAELDQLDAEILSVFPAQQIITPDDVRGAHETLEEAVLNGGWPTLGEARGRVLFALDNGGAVRAAYIEDHPALRGRVLFTSSPPGEPEAAFVKLNDPLDDFDLIQQAVRAGFIVRTRADADTVQARTGDTTRRDRALASGAQFVSTDYPEPNPEFGTGYFVEIPGGMPARCNPLVAPSVCAPLDIEDPVTLAGG